jgi:hypothetical protein
MKRIAMRNSRLFTVKKLVALSLLFFSGRFVAVHDFVCGTIDRALSSSNRNSTGDFWTVFYNLARTMIPPGPESVGPMLPNVSTTAQESNEKDKCESVSHL